MEEGLPSCKQVLQNEETQLHSQDERVKSLSQIVSTLNYVASEPELI